MILKWDVLPSKKNYICLRVCGKRQGKGKIVPVLSLSEHHAMKAYWKSGSIAPSILDLSTRWR
jgi:hypothetical protein